jgi:polyisoprenoid-binding protein YceI
LGQDKTVVGKTSKVSGTISTTLANPASTRISTIQIDASDLSTDSNMRNGAIQRFILQSAQSQYQYITFTPTAIEGLPATVSAGASLPVKITGNLKIRDVVQPVTFDATITLKSSGELAGDAKATVTRSAFNLTIPNVPSVADVTDKVALELQFVATKQ